MPSAILGKDDWVRLQFISLGWTTWFFCESYELSSEKCEFFWWYFRDFVGLYVF